MEDRRLFTWLRGLEVGCAICTRVRTSRRSRFLVGAELLSRSFGVTVTQVDQNLALGTFGCDQLGRDQVESQQADDEDDEQTEVAPLVSVLESVRAGDMGGTLDDWRAWCRADRRTNLLVCGDSLVRSTGRDEVGA